MRESQSNQEESILKKLAQNFGEPIQRSCFFLDPQRSALYQPVFTAQTIESDSGSYIKYKYACTQPANSPQNTNPAQQKERFCQYIQFSHDPLELEISYDVIDNAEEEPFRQENKACVIRDPKAPITLTIKYSHQQKDIVSITINGKVLDNNLARQISSDSYKISSDSYTGKTTEQGVVAAIINHYINNHSTNTSIESLTPENVRKMLHEITSKRDAFVNIQERA